MRVYSPSQGIDLLKQPVQEEPVQPEVSQIESALRGAAQGASFGFADELTGAVESGLINPEKTYEQARNESRANYQQAQQANPGTYMAGNIGGAIAPALISGGTSALGSGLATAGVIGSAGAKTIAGLAAQGAIQGGLQGLGESEGDNIGDIARDVASGAALGGVTGGVLGGASRGISKAVDMLPSGTAIKEGIENRVAGGITGLSDEGVDVLRKTPDALKRIESLGEGNTQDVILRKANDIEKFLENNPIKSRLDTNYNKALGLLDNSNATVSTAPIDNIIQSKINKLDVGGQKAFGESAQATQKYLENFRNQINQAFPDGQLDAPNAKRVIDQIRADIKKYGGFNNPMANDEIGNALKDVQRSLDQQLKSQVTGYGDIMKEVQKDTILNQRLTKSFFQKNEGIDINKIKNLLRNQTSNNPNLRDQKVVGKLSGAMQEFSGAPDLGKTIEDIKLKKMIEETPGNKGSNLVNAGAGLGAVIDTMTGLPFGVGTGLGALAGKRLETTGRKLTSSYFERQANKQPVILQKAMGTKYAPVLQSAAQRGTRNFAVAHYLLQQQDPEYRTLTDQEGDSD